MVMFDREVSFCCVPAVVVVPRILFFFYTTTCSSANQQQQQAIMGQVFGKKRAPHQDDGILQTIERKREVARESSIPTLKPYKFPVGIAGGGSSFGGGGGSKPDEIYKSMKHRNPHPDNFVPKCKVSGAVGEELRWMTPVRCAAWVENGDLLVTEAERIIRDHNVDATTGAEKMDRVYEILERLQEAESVAASEAPTENML